jgi:5-methylcytosine-specific restriction endonuclease McrA
MTRAPKKTKKNKGVFTVMARDIAKNAKSVTRKKLTPFERQCVAAHQSWRCNTCRVLFGPLWHVDHVKPLCDGGDDASNNMQALCADCHAAKTAMEARTRGRISTFITPVL